MTNWDVRRAAKNLDVTLIPFDPAQDARGYSLGRELAINPICTEPVFVALHELAHIDLGHTENISFARKNPLFYLPMEVKEVQVHSIALALAPEVGLRDGIDYDRVDELSYVQAFGQRSGMRPQAIYREFDQQMRASAKRIYEAGLV